MGDRVRREMGRVLWVLLVAVCAAGAPADTWPTVHHDASRSGRSDDSPAPPFQRKWIRLFCDENIHSSAEAIVDAKHVYIGTYAGNLYALSREDGSTVWTFSTGEMILASPAVADGTVYVTSLRGLHAVNADDGSEIWFRPIEYGFRTSPCLAGGRVIVGSRAGTLYAFEADTGRTAWTLDVGSPIYTSAACDGQGVYVAAEDARGRAVRLTDGKERWTSAPMLAASLRYYYPILWRDKVVFLTHPVANRHGLREAGYEMLRKRMDPNGPTFRSGKARLPLSSGMPDPNALQAETEAILRWLTDDPGRQSVWAFDRKTGRQAGVVPLLHTEGNAGIRCGAAVGAGDWLYSWSGSWFNAWDNDYPFSLNRIHPRTGANELCNYRRWHRRAPRTFGTSFEYNEAYNATTGGSRVYIAHSDNTWGLDVSDGTAFSIAGRRDMLGGVYGDIRGRTRLVMGDLHIARCPNEWHGTGRGGLSIAGSELYWLAGGMVQCFVGDGQQVTPAGDEVRIHQATQDWTPPPLPPEVEVSDRQWRRFLTAAPARSVTEASDDIGRAARQRLDAHVAEMLDTWPLAPLLTITGDHGGIASYARPREAYLALSHALPYVQPKTRERVVALLARELASGGPLSDRLGSFADTPRHTGGVYDVLDADERPLHTLHTVRPRRGDGLYAMWSLCHFGRRPDLAGTHWPAIASAWEELSQKVLPPLLERDWRRRISRGRRRNPQTGKPFVRLNLAIQSGLGYIRLATLAGRPAEARAAEPAVRRLLTARLNCPPDRISYYIPFRGEQALWYEMIPELARLLAENRARAIRTAVAGVHPATRTVHDPRRNNFWHLAHGEGLIFGETANAWPEAVLSLYQLHAYIYDIPPGQLLRLADMPWCSGDLAYLRKLTLVSWASADRPWAP